MIVALSKKLEWSPRLLQTGEDDTPEVGWVAIGELHVDYLTWDEDGRPHGYQRPLDPARIADLEANWKPYACGTAVVSRRADGSLWTVDGNHRNVVQSRLGRSVVLALIYSGLTPEREAELYHRLNNDRKGTNQWNRFGARGTSGDPKVHALIDLCAECGFKIGTADRSINSIAAVGALERIYGWPNGPRLLRQTLLTIKTVWPSDLPTRDGVFIAGLALFTITWDAAYEGTPDNKIDWKRFAALFTKVSGGDIVRKAKELKIEAGFALNPNTYALALRDIYNGKSNFRGRLEGKVAHPVASGGYRRFATSKNRISGR